MRPVLLLGSHWFQISELPLCKAYAGGTGEEYETIAARIRALLNLSPASSDVVLDTVRAAVEQGRNIEAIRLLRLHKGMRTADAKAFIDRLRSSRSMSL